MSREHRKRVWALIAAIFICTVVLSEVLRPGHNEYMIAGGTYAPGAESREVTKGALAGTTFQSLASASLGIREVLASLMWVRADDYFHKGEYRPIIGMVKQITAIDPHQVDVYATGAWHMAYNFMDKRLIQDGVKFLEEGAKNNDSIYDLYFELGYMHYDKTRDYPQAVRAYRDASLRGMTTGRKTPPSYVRHQLAHAMEKMGDIDQCLKQWGDNLEIGRKLVAEGEAAMGPSSANVDAARHNLYITARRRNERLAALAEREHNVPEALRLRQANVALAEAWLKETPNTPAVAGDLRMAKGHVDRLQAGKINPVAPANLDFQYTVTRIAPRKLRVDGTINVLNLARVRIQFQDKDYETRIQRGFDFKMDNCTLEWENSSVRKGRFQHVIDLDRDPADMGRKPSEIYPLKADEYEVSVTFNPRQQAAFIQDRYGWNGEQLTAKPEFLKIDASKSGRLEDKSYPLRTVSKSVVIKKEDILAPGRGTVASVK